MLLLFAHCDNGWRGRLNEFFWDHQEALEAAGLRE